MINILLAEDHQLVRFGLSQVLAREPEFNIVGEANTGQEAIELLENNVAADVLVTDINMPLIDGLQVAETVKARFPSVRTILLTVQDEKESIYRALNAGVKSYMLKTSDADELIFAIKQAARNRPYICSGVTDRLLTQFAAPQHGIVLSKNIEFSKREMEVLNLIAEGLTNEEAADKLFTSRRTVEGHRQSMINKTGARNTPALIRYAMRHGIID